MDSNSRDKGKVWTPLFFSLVLTAGMILGFNLRDSLRNKRDLGATIQRNDRIEEVIDLINEKYVDSVNNNTLYKDAISGVLKSLDPHTVFIPADELQSINDDLDGEFSGIGVEFSIMRDTISVTSVLDNSPAAGAGVQTGDQIIKVDDSVVAGVRITSDRIVHLLKGRKNTKVFVTLLRPSDSLRRVQITRDNIPIFSVVAGIMLDTATGYIKISRFSATTYKEFAEALQRLKDQGAKRLILDLRDNPGGYLDAATKIADAFLGDNKLIVYTRGLHSRMTEYRATAEGSFETGKLAVLVNEGSASASEIVAGAVQDWDRGVIAGRRTFGKGLVQEQYDLPGGSALRLTISRYYTPSGRCIQRSFARGRDAYMQEYEKRFNNDELQGEDTAATGDTTRYYTSNQRVVYGGGGIAPDVHVPYDTVRLSAPLAHLIYSEGLKTAIWSYFVQHRDQLKYKDIAEFARNFNAGREIWDRYQASLPPANRKETMKTVAPTANMSYLLLQIKAQMARILFHDNGYYAISLTNDNLVNKALDIMNGPQYSKIISGK